jgi:UDP-glucose 4-epimerase
VGTKRVLITGATGYLGGAVNAAFSNAKWEVLSAGRKDSSTLKMDFSKPELILNHPLLSDSIDVCVHVAAAHEVVCAKDPLLAMTINVLGSRALIEWCIAQKITRFIYVSTFHIFGNNQGDLIETVRPEPLNDYGLTHLLAEETALMFGRRGLIDVRILRPSNLIGIPEELASFNRWSLAPFDFCLQAARTGRIVLKSSGRQIRNWVGLTTFSDCVLKQSSEEGPKCIHVSGIDLSVIEMASLIAKSWRKNFDSEIKIITPEGVLELDESRRNFFSLYETETLLPDIDAFVYSVGSYLIANCNEAIS